MLNTVGSLVGAHSVGLLDCTTYAAGVSGDFFLRLLGTGTHV